MKVIIITGSVGTGKTTLAKRLAKEHRFRRIDVNKLVKEGKLYDSYDRKTKSFFVDTKKLSSFLIKLIKNSKQSLVIDSHLSHYLPRKYVDLCIVTKCDLKVLEKRLKKRKYSKEKIKENLECEIFDVCLNEAREKGYRIRIVDTSKK